MNKKEMIPRIVHYCWFGKGEKPKIVQKCIKSWEKQLEGYTFIEWNENNFDINSHLFVKEAYASKKYAFVSDYVRLAALYEHGGIYMDTDVEVLKPIDPLLEYEAFTGFEDGTFLQSGTMGFTKEHILIKYFLSYYDGKRFINHDGSLNMKTNTSIMTNQCKEFGLIQNGKHQVLNNGVTVFPRTYFSPYDYINGESFINEESYTIHHYAQTWLPASTRFKSSLKRAASKIIGPKAIAAMRNTFSQSGGGIK
ncbi:glycosyl transferase [Metabacillus sp. KIGAM252]|uniref:Glycosyl transferase n=1 Tax=Metabacillus flavus TaxID=2823519 RepID=A0ABS5LFZ3_9BACI|nr:glycosyltransferase [Metabacillus flavus]MBS2969658.1 glycosyl transferase [Metabacillus flavus]